jgi:hypothetical protein
MKKAKGTQIMVLAAITLLLFSACQSSGPVVWDDTYPEEKLATVQFNGMKIDGFNGINVEKFNWVKIPAGEATFSGDVTIYHAGVNFQTKGMEFTCMFEEGKEYKIYGRTNDMRWGVSVSEDGEFVAFVPFKDQPVFTN